MSFLSSAERPYDVLVVGGAPAGAAAAAVCARAGLSVRVVERMLFPRPKVCGDCLNPDVWPVLDRLGAAGPIRSLPHADLREVEFIGRRGTRVNFALPHGHERTVKRADLDLAMLNHASSLGAEVSMGIAVANLQMAGADQPGQIETKLVDGNSIHSRFVIAADGRNSVVGRALAPESFSAPIGREGPRRIGYQTHLPSKFAPAEFATRGRVRMFWFPGGGYGGIAPSGDGGLNVSLSIKPDRIPFVRVWAEEAFGLPADWKNWQTIAPLDRAPLRRPFALGGRVLLAGDSARVVEPFTGEGIYYALRTGELAGECVSRAVTEDWDLANTSRFYWRSYQRVYGERGRLWVNRLARAAALHPILADAALTFAKWRPGILRWLTAKVVPYEAEPLPVPL